MKYYSYKNLIYILLIVLVFGGLVFWNLNKNTAPTSSLEQPNVVINNTVISVMVADEADEQYQGLSDRESMNKDSGMLFVFPDYQVKTFVMRRMQFPLDIIYIKDNKVVKIYKNLEPEGDNPVNKYTSPEPINYVLEINGGFSEVYGIEEGDEVEINL